MLQVSKKTLSKFFSSKVLIIVIIILLEGAVFLYNYGFQALNNERNQLLKTQNSLKSKLTTTEKQLTALKNEDQYKKNKQLEATIKSIEQTYKKSVSIYEKILDLPSSTKKTAFNQLFAQSLDYLSERNYSSAAATLTNLDTQINTEIAKNSAGTAVAANVPANNTPPGSGYSRQKVSTDIGDFIVDIIAADLNSTRVIVDTATDGDCKDNCPVLSLGDYAARSGAYAGVNGSYFCPADYPSCAGKTNSFDTLAMNKNKKYINSDNNIYSTVPAVIFLGNSARFVGASQEWGRDTGVDSVLANYPLLVSGGNVTFGGSGDPKQGSKGSRSFVGASGSTAYIGVVHNVTVAEMARVLQKMGIQGALNLDSGGSTALWNGGYKVGPGRNLPNVILFVRK